MENRGRKLSKKEQKKIVSKTNYGGLPLNVGYSIGVDPNKTNGNTKAKVTITRTVRKRG